MNMNPSALRTARLAAVPSSEARRFPHPRRWPSAGLLLAAAMFAFGFWNAPAQEEKPATETTEPAAATAPATAVESTTAEMDAVPATDEENSTATIQTGDSGSSTNGLRLNFRNAPIDLVLNYLSEAAGFIIELDTNVRGTVNVISAQPMSKDEAVDLLNSVLNRNGYAAVRSGERTLKIMDKAAAKLNNPVRIGSEPSTIPNNDELVTQIIPIRYVEAAQLVTDISPFVSSGATIIANQAGNSIIITDTQSNIRHLAEIIKAIDSSAEDVTEVKVFKLRYADPSEMATLLAGLFPDQSGTAQAPIRFGGRGGFRGFFGGGGGGNNNASSGNSQSDRIKKRNQVVAVADARTSSVIVTATKDLMEQISEMVFQLDNPGKAQRMQVIHINNADPSEVMSVLQDTVGASTSRNSRNTQNSPFQSRIQQNINSSASGSSSFGGGRSSTLGGGGSNR